MRCEVLAVGTELLLGDIVDTNGSWIGEQLAKVGIDSYVHAKVGDNQARIADALRWLLARTDAVIMCGGIGPTHDDVTRESVAEVAGVPLERREELVERIGAMFSSRGRVMSENNKRQADIPRGAAVLDNPLGTAPGFACRLGNKMVYVVPGVPREMRAMVADHVIPDLLQRGGDTGAATIVSRTLKTWGAAESALAEMVAPRIEALEGRGNPTLAFLARGIEGIVVRITAKASTDAEARSLIDAEEPALRAILGDLIFGVDDESMEHAVIGLLRERGLTMAVAESLTGGLVSARLCGVPGASEVFRGAVVSYAGEVKRSVLGVTATQVVSEDCARQMAEGARHVLGADIGLALTGVAGPDEMEGQPVGTVIVGIADDAGGGAASEATRIQLPGDREQIRQFATISSLNMLRLRIAGAELPTW